jgi:hypothetical protein
MSKRSGIGMGAAYAGYSFANDIGALSIGGGPALIEVTGIDKSGHERKGGLIDGHIDLDAFFNDAAAQMHAVASPQPSTDRQLMVFLASTIGAAAACMVGKQLDYAPTRNADGSLPIALPHPANGFGMEWCELLTAGYRTDTSATNGTSLDGTAATTTGWAAYLQVVDVTGTNVVVTLEDSANNIAFAAVTGGAFTSVTADRSVERIEGAIGATLRRYVRAVTSGTFISATFIVAVIRRPIGS